MEASAGYPGPPRILENDKTEIETLVTELEEVTKKEDYTAMKELMEQLKKDMMRILKSSSPSTYKKSGDDRLKNNIYGKGDVIDADFSVEE